jgi:hypothetical protein
VKRLAVTVFRREGTREPAIPEARHRVALRRTGRNANTYSFAPETAALLRQLLLSHFPKNLSGQTAWKLFSGR